MPCFYFQANGWSTESTQTHPDGKILCLSKTAIRKYWIPNIWLQTHVYPSLTICTFHLSIASELIPISTLHQCVPLTRLDPAFYESWAPSLQCPSGAAAIRTLTRTTSSSLFLCISCFSSSTILDMASFSVSCSFSDNCKGLKGKLCHHTRPFSSGPRFPESGALRRPRVLHVFCKLFFWKCEYL